MNTNICLRVCDHISGKECRLSIDDCQHSKRSRMVTKTQTQKAPWQIRDSWTPRYIRSFEYARYDLSAIKSLKAPSTSLQSLYKHTTKSISPLKSTKLTSPCTKPDNQNHLHPRTPNVCEERWTQYKDCNHEHTPMRRTIRCHRLEDDVNARQCPQYRRVRRTIRYPDMCGQCRANGAVPDEGFKGGRWDSR